MRAEVVHELVELPRIPADILGHPFPVVRVTELENVHKVALCEHQRIDGLRSRTAEERGHFRVPVVHQETPHVRLCTADRRGYTDLVNEDRAVLVRHHEGDSGVNVFQRGRATRVGHVPDRQGPDLRQRDLGRLVVDAEVFRPAAREFVAGELVPLDHVGPGRAVVAGDVDHELVPRIGHEHDQGEHALPGVLLAEAGRDHAAVGVDLAMLVERPGRHGLTAIPTIDRPRSLMPVGSRPQVCRSSMAFVRSPA